MDLNNLQNNLDVDVTSLDQLAERISSLRQSEYPTNVRINNPSSDASLPTVKNLNAQDFNNFLDNLGTNAYDPLKINRESTFASKPMLKYQLNPSYNSVGYNPLADNEAVYNQQTSWLSDFGRANKLILPAIGDFAWETMTNYDLTDWSSDIEGAKEYSDKMDLMMSSRGGVSGFGVNLYAQLAPTLGVLAGIGAEQIAAKGIEFGASRIPGLQGLTGTAATLEANSARQFFKLPKLLSQLEKAKDSFNAFRTLDNASKVRAIYSSAVKGGMSFVKGINPLSNTFKAYSNIKSGAAGVALAGDMSKLYRTAGGLWRDVQNYRVVLNESNLEGGLAINEYIKGKRDEYIKIHGYEPTGEDAYAIYNEAQDIGAATQMINMGLIHLTNSFGFNKIVDRAFSPRAVAAKNFAEKFGAYIVENGVKGAGKVGYKILENNYKKWGSKAYYKYLLSTTPHGLLSYFGNNLMEGTQEFLQEATVNGVTNYYENLYSNPTKIHKATIGESIKAGLGSQISGQGAEVFLSGFLTGGLTNVVTSPIYSVFTKANKLIDPEGYKKALEISNEQKNKIFTSANYVAENRAEFFSMLDNRANEQLNFARVGQISEALGDEKTARDIKDGATFSHVYNLYKAGRVDIIKDQLNGLLELEDDELADALNENVQSPEEYAKLRTRVKDAIKRVGDIQRTIDKVNEQYENPYRPWDINKKSNPDMFNEEYARWDAYEDAKYFAAFALGSYSRANERMQSILNEMSSSPIFSNVAGMGVSRMFSATQMQEDAANLRQQAKIYRENNETAKADEIDNRANIYENLAKNSNLYSKFLQFAGKADPLTDAETKDLDKVKQKLAEQGIVVDELSEDDVQDIEKLLKDSFSEYVKDLAKENPNVLLDSNINNIFTPYKDWHKLGDDTTVMSKWVNLLSDPVGFNRIQNNIRASKEEVYANRKRILKEQKDRYMKGLIKDKLLKDLYNIGVMVSREDEDAFLNESRYPNLIDSKTMEPIKNNDKRIAAIQDIFDQYEELNDVLVNDKPIYDASDETIFANALTDAAGRNKSEKDNRTYSDIVEALGLDEKADDQEVDIEKVYDFITNSKFSTPAEKKLVERLKDKYKKAKVTVSKSHNSPLSFDDTNGLIIDLRYAADEYKAGKMRAEFIMLKGIMTAMTFNFIDSDAKFTAEIEEMRKAVSDAIKANPKLLDEYGGRMPRALSSNKEFVNDVMTNSLFQAVVARVKSTKETKKNVFADFVKSVKQFVAKLLGIKTTRSSILDQAANIIGSKIQDTDYTKPFKKEPPKKKAEVKVDEEAEEGTDELTDEELIDQISQNTAASNMPQSLLDMLDPEFKKVLALTNAKYTKSGFINFVGTSPKAASIIQKWKKSEKARLKKEAEEAKKKKESVKKKTNVPKDEDEPVELTDADKEGLYELGYSRADINAMGELAIEVLQEKMSRADNPVFPSQPEGDFTAADAKVESLRKKVLENPVQLTDDKKAYEPKDKKKAEKENKPLLYERVSELIGKKFESENDIATERGNITDEIYRDYMSGKITSIPELREALEKLSAEKGIFKYTDDFVLELFDTMQFIKDYLTSAGFKINADFPTLSGDIAGPRAGTIDFMIYDEDGNITFIDLKTSTTNLVNKYNNPEKDEYQYKAGHTIQQNAYRELFRQQTNENVENLLILPLQISFNRKTGVHEGIKVLKSGENKYTLPISTARDIYQLKGIGRTAGIKPTTTTTDIEAKKADIVQTYEYKGKTQTVKKEVSTKDGITKVTFVGERSDKPGVSSKSGYTYGGVASNSVQQFFDDYGITVEDIAEDLSINDIKAIQVIEERTGEGITAITFRITYSEEMGGMSSEPMEMAVKKQKFTSDAELAALEGKPTTGTTPKTKDVIGDKEYNDFIDNGVVTPKRIKSIANKVKAGVELSPREMEIFTDKTSEINAEIAKSSAKATKKEKVKQATEKKKAEKKTPKKEEKPKGKTKEELTKERDDLIQPLEQEKSELGKILEKEQSKRLVKDTVDKEITADEMSALKKELGNALFDVTDEDVKSEVVTEVVRQMNEKKPSRPKTLLQKVANRIKRVLLNFMIGTVLFNTLSFTYNPQDQVLTYQTVNVENLESFDSALLDQEATNRLDNLNVITKSFEDSSENYLIVDKSNAVAHLFQGDSLIDTFEVGTGRKVGDAQTKTVISNGKVLWEQGNQQTGAGIYTVGGIGQYKSSPSYTLKNEEGIEVPTVLHETLADRKKLFADNDVSNNRMSFGCVNFKAESLKKLATYKSFTAGSKVFILPDDTTNKFQLVDGELRFISQDTNVNRTIKGYTPQPIAIKTDRQSAVINNFVNSIADNKAKIMALYPSISNATYNQIANIAYGILGQESTFGTFGGIRGQFGKVRDDVQSYLDYGVPSVGVTQIRYTSVNNKVKEAFGISNQDMIKDNPAVAAVATMAILLDVYENEIPSNLKQDFRTLLPLAYSNRTEFAKAVRGDASTYENQYVRNVNEFAKDLHVYQGVPTTTPESEESKPSSQPTLAFSLIGLAAAVKRKNEYDIPLTDEDVKNIEDRIAEINNEIAKIQTLYANLIKKAPSEQRKKASDITESRNKKATFAINKGDIIKMEDGTITQVTKVSKNQIEVVPYMQGDGDVTVINQEDITSGKAIVVKPGEEVIETEEVTPETNEVLSDSTSNANTVSNDTSALVDRANAAEKQTAEERKSSFKEKLKNRCK